MRIVATVLVALHIAFSIAFSGTTGKIAGTVTDARTGERLVSANVIVQGINIGAVTNADGYFAILNVPPGTYTVKASLLGYRATVVADVRVFIDQTTERGGRVRPDAKNAVHQITMYNPSAIRTARTKTLPNADTRLPIADSVERSQ